MEVFLICIGAYLLVGLGFTLASWLQAAEKEVDAGKNQPAFLSKTFVVFIFVWPVIALYCYRAEVKKSINKVDLSNYHG